MAAPKQLKANRPGGVSFSSSRRAQKTKDGKVERNQTKPKLRTQTGKSTAVKTAYSATTAPIRPRVKGVSKSQVDYASAWMQAHGLKNAQNGGSVGRIRYASVPADMIGATGGGTRNSGSSRPARRNPSGVTKSKRVKVTVTGRNFMNTRKPRIVSARTVRKSPTRRTPR